MRVLVVGGAGYIGSHMVKFLGEAGVEVTTLDNLSSGRRRAVTHGDVVEGELGERALPDRLFGRTGFDGVMHFAAHFEVGESVVDPAKCCANNVVKTQVLLDAVRDRGIDKLTFSSPAAIFGEPRQRRIDENHAKAPINPNGRTRLVVEQMLRDYDVPCAVKSVCLRYCNAAGADPSGANGECHEPETHLIRLVLRAASGRSEAVTVFGTDHDTPDGTCIHDYVHVNDLCDAHMRAIQSLWNGAATAATGREIPIVFGSRRNLVRYVYRVSRGLIGNEVPDSLNFPKINTFGTIGWFRRKTVIGRWLNRLVPGHRQGSSFNRFGYLLAASAYDEAGISCSLPDHVDAEESSEWLSPAAWNRRSPA